SDSFLRPSLRPKTSDQVSGAFLHGIVPGGGGEPDEVGLREIWSNDGRKFCLGPLSKGRWYFCCSAPYPGWAEVLQTGVHRWIRSWESLGPTVMDILERVTDWQQIHYEEVCDARLVRWDHKSAIALGGAAHSTLPHLRQGAGSGMVDGFILMHMLANG